MSKERYINLSDRQVKDTQNQSQDFLSVKTICRLLNKQDQKISDLEAKLAEKEDRTNWLVEAEFNRKWAKKYVEMRRKEDPMLCLPDSDEVYEKYFELKQQLAEKDHTINTLIEDHKASQEWYKMQIADTEAQNKRVLEKLDIIVRSNQELEKQHDIDNQVIQLMEDNREKDKISFCIEELEALQDVVEDKVNEYLYTHNMDNYDEFVTHQGMYSCFEILVEEIDNQIKQLKEGK